MDRGGKVFLGLLGLGTVITAVVVFSQPTKAPAGTGTLTGLVSDLLGPLPGVRVTLDGRATMTGSGGTFTFAGVIEGAYSMSFSKAGYQTVNL